MTSEHTKTTLLETLLSSKTRIKILRVLIRLREVNITKLTRITELNHKVVRYHINILKEYGIVEEKHIGRICIIRLNESNPKVKILQELFRELDIPEQQNSQKQSTSS